MTSQNWADWLVNVRKFGVLLAIMYLTTIVGVIQAPGHLVTLQDFIPSQVAIGGMIFYGLSIILDWLKKYSSEN